MDSQLPEPSASALKYPCPCYALCLSTESARPTMVATSKRKIMVTQHGRETKPKRLKKDRGLQQQARTDTLLLVNGNHEAKWYTTLV
jgi:hypothetical protein